MGSDTRIEEIRATDRAHRGAISWLLRDGADNDYDAGILHRHILLAEIDRLTLDHDILTEAHTALVVEQGKLKTELVKAQEPTTRDRWLTVKDRMQERKAVRQRIVEEIKVVYLRHPGESFNERLVKVLLDAIEETTP